MNSVHWSSEDVDRMKRAADRLWPATPSPLSTAEIVRALALRAAAAVLKK